MFTRAVRSFTPLLIGLGGQSGGGKTFSALRLATGLADGKPIAFIDTERGRALHYADRFVFDHQMLAPPFTPEQYMAMIEAAEAHVGDGGCIVIDSMSHEWEGPGGLLETASNAAARMAEKASKSQNRYVSPDVYTFPSWREPKQRHQRLVNRILQLRCHAIFCFRAKEKMKLVKNEKNRQEVVSDGIKPIIEEGLPYEMTLFAMLHPNAPGVPDFRFKALAEQFRGMFNGKALTEDHGKALAAWASGGGKFKPAPIPMQSREDDFDGGHGNDGEDEGLPKYDATLTIHDHAGAAHSKVPNFAEALKKYGELKRAPGVDPRDVARHNIPLLRSIATHEETPPKLRDRLNAEIEAAEAVMEPAE